MTRLLPLGLLLALGLSGCPQVLDTLSQQHSEPKGDRDAIADNQLSPSHIEPIPKDDDTVTSEIAPLPAEPMPVDAILGTFLSKENRTLQHTDFQAEYMDLNSDGYDEALVLLTDSYWCGMAGCNLVVFEGSADGYDLVSSMTLVHAPVGVSETQTNGWNDLIIHISGGGIAAQDVVLKYDGTAYPVNPSLQEAIAPGTARKAELFTANASTPRSFIQPLQPAQPVADSNTGSRNDHEHAIKEAPWAGSAPFPPLCDDWQPVASFETENYWVSICQDANGWVYTGREKSNPGNWMRLNEVAYDGRTYRARNSNTTYAINAESLMVLQNGEAIATEPVLRTDTL